MQTLQTLVTALAQAVGNEKQRAALASGEKRIIVLGALFR